MGGRFFILVSRRYQDKNTAPKQTSAASHKKKHIPKPQIWIFNSKKIGKHTKRWTFNAKKRQKDLEVLKKMLPLQQILDKKTYENP